MIDIVFQLVLFFMVSTTFVQSPGIQVDLPRSSAQTVISDESDINIWMTLDGSVYVDDAPVTSSELRALLKARARKNPRTMVVLKADTGVTHGRVVVVMDMARSLGLTKIAIATELGLPENR
jgi:biopolymer transport protein ExbD/biopolymer transport protein TolR